MRKLEFDHGIVKNDATRFWKKDVIPATGFWFPKNATLKWFQSDTDENYHRRGNRHYGIHDIDYTFNSNGYRSMEYDPASPHKKIAFLGCSFTQGIGLPYHEIWTSRTVARLEQHFGRTIEQHNFGLGGHGNDVIGMTAFQTITAMKPDLMVVMFTDPSRRSAFVDWDKREAFLASEPANHKDKWKAVMTLQNNTQDFFEWVRNFNLIDMAARAHGVPWVWTIAPTGAKPLDLFKMGTDYVRNDNHIPQPFPEYVKRGDFARDKMHAGGETNDEFSADVANFVTQYFSYAFEKE